MAGMGVFALISSVSVGVFPKLANVQHRKSTLIDLNGYRLTFFSAKMYLTSDTTSETKKIATKITHIKKNVLSDFDSQN
jgi:hypothetical protein